jgi:hypothetical protein
MEKIIIKEETKIPGTNIILETGDGILVKNTESFVADGKTLCTVKKDITICSIDSEEFDDFVDITSSENKKSTSEITATLKKLGYIKGNDFVIPKGKKVKISDLGNTYNIELTDAPFNVDATDPKEFFESLHKTKEYITQRGTDGVYFSSDTDIIFETDSFEFSSFEGDEVPVAYSVRTKERSDAQKYGVSVDIRYEYSYVKPKYVFIQWGKSFDYDNKIRQSSKMISLIKEAQDFANRVAKYLKLKVVN